MIRFILTLLIPLLLISARSKSLSPKSEEPVFIKKKTLPIYNRKYILKAEHNIESNNCEEDYNDPENELTDSAAANREMYRRILMQQNGSKQSVESSHKKIRSNNNKTSSACNARKNYNTTPNIQGKSTVNAPEVNQETNNLENSNYDDDTVNMQILHSLQNEINKLKEELYIAKAQLANHKLQNIDTNDISEED